MELFALFLDGRTNPFPSKVVSAYSLLIQLGSLIFLLKQFQ